jgi:hypothetical protein
MHARNLTVNSGTSRKWGNTQACGAHQLHVFGHGSIKVTSFPA